MKLRSAIKKAASYANLSIERVRSPLPGRPLPIVEIMLKSINEARSGQVIFIEIGANDGIQEDPLRDMIEAHPWAGVLVEPQPLLAEQLRSLYRDKPCVSIEQSVIAERPGEFQLWYLDPSHPCIPEWASGIASLELKSIRQHQDKFGGFDAALKNMKVPGITFAQLLAKYSIPRLDVLVIDAEGYDEIILRSIDVKRLLPPIIIYETCNLAHDAKVRARAKLAECGYEFGEFFGDTIAALPQQHWSR